VPASARARGPAGSWPSPGRSRRCRARSPRCGRRRGSARPPRSRPEACVPRGRPSRSPGRRRRRGPDVPAPRRDCPPGASRPGRTGRRNGWRGDPSRSTCPRGSRRPRHRPPPPGPPAAASRRVPRGDSRPSASRRRRTSPGRAGPTTGRCRAPSAARWSAAGRPGGAGQASGDSVNPVPRTLWIRGGSPAASSFRRRRPTWTSIRLDLGVNR